MEKRGFFALLLAAILVSSIALVSAVQLKDALAQTTNSAQKACLESAAANAESLDIPQSQVDGCMKLTAVIPKPSEPPKVSKQVPDLIVEKWEFDLTFRKEYINDLKRLYPEQFKNFKSEAVSVMDAQGNPTLTEVYYKKTIEATCYFKGNSGRCRAGPLNLIPGEQSCQKDVAFDVNFREAKSGNFITKRFKENDIVVSSINDECWEFPLKEPTGEKSNQCSDILFESCFGKGTTNSVKKTIEVKGQTLEPLFLTRFTAPTEAKGFARFTIIAKNTGDKANAIADFTGRKISRYPTTDDTQHILALNSHFQLQVAQGEKPQEQANVLAEEAVASTETKAEEKPKGLIGKTWGLITSPFKFATKVVKFPFKLVDGALKNIIKDPKKGLYANVKNWIDKTFFAREIKITKELANVKLTDAQKKKLKECEESRTTLGASSSEVKQVQVSCRCLEFPELFKDTCQYALARNYVSVTEYSSLIRDKCTTEVVPVNGTKALYAGKKWDSLTKKQQDACYALYKVPTPNLAFVPFQIKILGGASSAVASATQPSKPSTSASTTAPASQQPGAPASAQAEAELIRRQARSLAGTGLKVELERFYPPSPQPSTQYFTTIPAGGLIGSYSVDGQPLGGVGMGGYGAPDKAPPLNTIVSSGGGGGPGSSAQVTESPPGTEVTAESTDEGDLVITEQCVSEEECAAGVTSVEVTDPAESDKKVITFVSDPVDLSAVSEVSAPLAGRSNAEIVSLFVLLSLLAVLGATSWYYFHEKKLVE